MSLRDKLFGKPIPDFEAGQERISTVEGVAALGLDALASAAYGPEAALTALLVLGASGHRYILPITAAIAVILLLVQFSYRQTIAAYPDGGGSYTVAHQNLGARAGLLAATALCLDYLLNVAVAISAGVGALASAVPRLLPAILPLCLALLLLLTLVNLRGIRSAGLAFVVPTYLFVVTLGAALVLGVAKIIIAGGHPAPVVPPPSLPAATTPVSVWLLLRAFANGCTAMTGVEAVSNAVPVFREPRTQLARRTLTTIITILVLMLAGIAVLSRVYGINATPPGHSGYQSVLSQLLGAVMGRGAFYYVAMAGILSVLCLSANTSFADFPRVCRLLALDGYLPAAFAHSGRRLVYSTGIVVLALLSGALLVAFGGITDKLIPLFAVGALLAFTMSQAGMVAHWRREKRAPHARQAMVINGIGAAATGTTVVLVLVSKFTEGAWLSALFIPLVFALLHLLHRHHTRLARETRADGPLDIREAPPPLVVVPIRSLDRVTRKALQFAMSISPDVRAVQVILSDQHPDDLSRSWHSLVEAPAQRAHRPPPNLVVLRTAYRQLIDPLLGYVRRLGREDPARFVAVVVPELVEPRWYHRLLHSHTATALKLMLLFHGGPHIVVIDTPWHTRERPAHRTRRRALPLPTEARG